MKKKHIAVLAAHRSDYHKWVQENKKPDEKYYCITKIEHTFRIRFHRIEMAWHWRCMKDYYKVFLSAKRHLRNYI